MRDLRPAHQLALRMGRPPMPAHSRDVPTRFMRWRGENGRLQRDYLTFSAAVALLRADTVRPRWGWWVALRRWPDGSGGWLDQGWGRSRAEAEAAAEAVLVTHGAAIGEWHVSYPPTTWWLQ